MATDQGEISPVELVADVLERLGDPTVTVVVGPASDSQQQAGVVSIVVAGLPEVERRVPVQWARAQARCLAGSLETAERLAYGVQRDLHGRGRTIARMASTNQKYLIHLVNVTAGPSMHFDSPETWELLLFAEIMISSEPL